MDLAVAELRYETAFYQEAVQAMMDGVTLGAEQVQDKRIEFLEIGPSADPEAAVLLFALTLVLEGTVGPAAAALATRAVMRPVMRATAKAINARARQEAGILAQDIRLFRQEAEIYREAAASVFTGPRRRRRELLEMAKDCEEQAETLLQDLRGKPGSARSVRKALDEVTTFTQDNLVAATKGAIAVHGASGSSKDVGPASTPGVEARAAAMASASKLRLTVVAVHEALEAELRTPGIMTSAVRQILSDYRLDTILDLAHIRESFQSATEAMIWARLLLDQALIDIGTDRVERAAGRDLPDDIRARRLAQERLTGRPSMGLVDAPFLKIRGVDKKVVDYLSSRFRKELERWIAENNKTIPIRDAVNLPGGSRFEGRQPGSLPPGWWDKLGGAEREDFLVQYLIEVSNRSPEFKLR